VPSASITARRTKRGVRRYVVRARLGGRASPVEHGGSFPTMRQARVRRDFIAGELAAGRNPADALRALTEQAPRRTFRQWADSYERGRVDVGERTRAVIRSHFTKILPALRTATRPHSRRPMCRRGSRAPAWHPHR
jgi:hypothetical protein